jgi:CO dehydrogenase maturation factor
MLAPDAYFMHVGTYENDGIGTSCYHGNLAIFENVVSHTQLEQNEWLVGDMVAGTDAFASAAHVLFDAICIVVEPTPESVGVYRQFMGLAKEAGIERRVHVVGNKIMDEDDVKYLANEVDREPAALIPYDNQLRKLRQTGGRISDGPNDVRRMLRLIALAAEKEMPSAKEQHHLLHSLHFKLAHTKYIQDTYGDVSGQSSVVSLGVRAE